MGEIVLPNTVGDFETVFEFALEAGAEDIEDNDEFYNIYTAMDNFGDVQKALEDKYETIERSGLIWKPKTMIDNDLSTAEKNMRLIDILEDNEDVQAVFTNMDMSDEVAEKLAEGIGD